MKYRTLQLITAAAMFAATPLAFAQNAPQTQPQNTGSEPMMHQQNQMQNQRESTMHHKHMRSGMMGSHSMPATVKSVDHGTGVVKVESEGMDLKVHFPPSQIKNLKDGDKISLHLSYKMKGHMGGMNGH